MIDANVALLGALAERLHADVYRNGPVYRLTRTYTERHTSAAKAAEKVLGTDVKIDKYAPSTPATAVFEVGSLPGMEVDQDLGTTSADLSLEDCDRIIETMDSIRRAILQAERGA